MITLQDRLLSLNEVETLGAKAARGAGFAWGLAEDIGRAARWMAERHLDWTGPVLDVTRAGEAAERLRHVFRHADLMPGARPGTRWDLGVIAPVWPIAILSAALPDRDMTLDVGWAGAIARLRPDEGASATAHPARLALAEPQAVSVEVAPLAPALPFAVAAGGRRSRITAARLHDLEALSARTYVASSSHSRATGAGGGRVDDD